MSEPVLPQKSSAFPLGWLLVLEASTTAGSVALIADGALVAMHPVAMGAGREDRLFPAVESLLKAADVVPHQLLGIVCGEGPGSFTSLRIAASLAKGLAHGASVPLFAVSSLLLAASDAGESLPAGRAVVHGDALRGERYVLDVMFDENGHVHAQSALRRMTLHELDEHVGSRPRLAVLSSPVPERESLVVTPWSSHLLRVARQAWTQAVPLDSWEPQYGRLAEAQVKWEASHGATLPSLGAS
ncbi:tRNA (adenosine(37)-N6)-threonylcarbamoyltransferase complex dimerization subunit type 1 TsaB [Gemmatimonas groenlandica]|uniref:tRNA (Adenosine(37)-N6)-threonylcarbamoyltransferase complex dimerization subunit type 1 TsaB n=1 Tax=Gemmatimonas groenlandica TaxID=2732249 RepID=A0A6M4IJP4_9BACT|nr:tRNA (adenosine(37)-N6)-threonylcarbamoyltransferase complex dimerization subunit type 1 TsaB [Gemmatimonas groenlandica]QJR34840.1 tRNA (adenosine(37)-N6)-threonylcarbamoyltransferase complex dimerization subunit type 1 TsaB [Gemmatimonas groenlandica]